MSKIHEECNPYPIAGQLQKETQEKATAKDTQKFYVKIISRTKWHNQNFTSLTYEI